MDEIHFAPGKKPWNDASPVTANTGFPRFQLGAKGLSCHHFNSYRWVNITAITYVRIMSTPRVLAEPNKQSRNLGKGNPVTPVQKVRLPRNSCTISKPCLQPLLFVWYLKMSHLSGFRSPKESSSCTKRRPGGTLTIGNLSDVFMKTIENHRKP